MTRAGTLRVEAERLGQSLPALLAEAERLSSALSLGLHGRKRAGQGADFWQYRPAMPGDSARSIDWRRSARSDAPFVREREWQASQGVTLWVDPSRSMQFQGASARPTKAGRAAVLALSLGISLLKGGERVGVEGQGRPRAGLAQTSPESNMFASLPVFGTMTRRARPLAYSLTCLLSAQLVAAPLFAQSEPIDEAFS